MANGLILELGGWRDARAQLPQLGNTRRKVRATLDLQLGQGGHIGALQLNARMGESPLIEVAAGAQRELLAQQRLLARAEEDREALLRAQRGDPPAGARLLPGQFERFAPVPVGDLLALAPAGSDRERAGRRGLVDVGVGGGDAVGVQHPPQHIRRGARLALGVDRFQPRLGLCVAGHRLRVDDGRAGDGHGGRFGLARHWMGACAATSPQHALDAARRAHGAQHDDVLGLALWSAAQQVAPVGGAQLPGELELHEEKQSLGHPRTVSFMTMSDESATKGLRERLATGTEDRLGRALSDLLDNSLLTGAIGRAFDAREKAAQAQELAMGALNLPSAADIERLTRRLRSLSQRLEGIEDGVDRLNRSLTAPKVEARLERIEEQLGELSQKVAMPAKKPPVRKPAARKPAAKKPVARKTSAAQGRDS